MKLESLINSCVTKIQTQEQIIQEAVNKEVKNFVDKWGVEFKAGMGTHFFHFINDVHIKGAYEDDPESIDTITDGQYFPDAFHKLDGVSEWKRMREDWDELVRVACIAGDDLDKNCGDWFLDGADDCKATTPNETKTYTKY